MPTKSEVIKKILEARTHKDLAALYHLGMEVQVNVAQDGGTVEEGEFKGRNWRGYTDGIQHWKSFRIPYNASTTPEYTDFPIKFDLAEYAESIGMTGWNWKDRKSCWVAFDFDAIVGHSDKHQKKLTQVELRAVENAVSGIPWVTIRKSTSGKGIHLYVFLDGVSTANHNEHAALGRAILGQMSGLAGYDFQSKVDTCGGNMWVWHRKMAGTPGLALVKQGVILYDIPPHWWDHVKVITGQKRKTVPQFVEESKESEQERIFQELCGQHVNQPLDEEHKKLIDWLQGSNAVWWWDADNHMLVTHTTHLRDAHKALGFRGNFETISSHGSEHNCFAYPLRRGAWAVRRYTPGVREHDSWEQDGQGWTRTYLNRDPNLASVARAKGANEDPAGGWVFREAEMAHLAIAELGVKIKKELPPFVRAGRQTRVKPHKDGSRIVVEIERSDTDDASAMQGWLPKGKNWVQIFNTQISPSTEPEIANYDDVVRHLVTESGQDFGWVVRSDNQWRTEPLIHVRAALEAQGVNDKEAKLVVGSSVYRPWVIVNRPFQPEYPGDRSWNRQSAQLRYLPSVNKDRLTYPHWIKLLNHCGEGLNDAIAQHPWAQANGILTGGDYLKLWIASLFQFPTEPLPYLFFHSKQQNTGKSSFHEAIELLMTAGTVRADIALTNPSGFNGELMHAVLCVVEEIDLRKNTQAYARIKDWVTAINIAIRKMHTTTFMMRNTTHWIQVANESEACPVFPGDTRITMIYVAPIDPLEMIPKKDFLPALEKEAPDFVAELLRIEIPPSGDRLNIPVISTDEKKETEELNKTALELFIGETIFHVSGELIKFSDFYDRFCEWLPTDELATRKWTKIAVGKHFQGQRKFVKARSPKDGQFYVGNMSWKPYSPGDPVKKLLTAREGMLTEVPDANNPSNP